MKRPVTCCLLAAVAFCAAAAAAHAQDISVKAVHIYENRQKRLVDDKQSAGSSYLSLRLRFKGDAVKKLTRLGDWQIASGKDDQGTDLVRRSKFASKTLFRTYRSFSAFSKTAPPEDQYETTYTLNVPPRGAKTLTAFAGTVRLSLSDIETVSIPISKLNDMKGKEIADPLFKKAGLTVTLERVSVTNNNVSVGVKFQGETAAREKFLRLRFEDKSGKILTESNTFAGFREGSGSVYSYRKLNPDDFLKLDVETKRQDVTVRFDLKDIPLP